MTSLTQSRHDAKTQGKPRKEPKVFGTTIFFVCDVFSVFAFTQHSSSGPHDEGGYGKYMRGCVAKDMSRNRNGSKRWRREICSGVVAGTGADRRSDD
jgi:hypothetical protein